RVRSRAKRMAHVVSVSLEGQTQKSNRLAVPFPAQRLEHLAAHRVCGCRWTPSPLPRSGAAPGALAGLEQRHGVLGKTRSAVSGPGLLAARPSPPVEADHLGYVAHVGADFFAEVGDLIDETDLGREECIGRILSEFSRPARHHP